MEVGLLLQDGKEAEWEVDVVHGVSAGMDFG